MRAEPRHRRLAIGGGAILLLSALLLATLLRSGSEGPTAPLSLTVPLASARLPVPAAEARAPTAPAAPEGLRLHGIAGAGAIIDDGRGGQRLVALGREATPGLVLERTALDHVMLRSSGGLLRLDFAGATQAAATPSAALDSLAGAGARGDSLPYRLGLTPRQQGGQVTGHVVSPGASLPALERVGIRAGDVILAVNGSRFDQERLLELPWTLANSERVAFEIERGGRRLQIGSR